MEKLNRILVVVDPTADTHPCIEKAARLALAFAAGIELVICDFYPAIEPSYLDQLESPAELSERVRESRMQKLQALAGALRGQGIKVTVDVRLERPLHRGIVNKIRGARPDLVVKDTHYHPVIRRTLITNTDWHLIREPPAPLLLVKPTPWRREGLRLLAAVDPGHLDDKPAALDHEILETMEYLQTRLHGSTLAIHVFDISYQVSVGLGIGEGSVGGPVAAQLLEDLRSAKKRALDELASRHHLTTGQVRLVDGSPVDVLPEFAAAEGIDIELMGAIARGPAFNFFVGSTAERVLDRLPCDILIVKPRALMQHLQAAG